MTRHRAKPEDKLESPAATDKRLGITAKTRKAAERYACRIIHWGSPSMIATAAFLAGAAWERRRRAKDGY